MKNAICLLVFSLFCSSAGAQSNSPMLEGFDAFSLMLEVAQNLDLRNRFAITDDTNEKITQFLADKEIRGIGLNFLKIQAHGPSESFDKLAKLDGKFVERWRQTFPELPFESIRAWAIKRLYRTPDSAFLSPNVHKYLSLSTATVEELMKAANGSKPIEELRMEIYEKRAKEIVMAFPATTQVLFARYAGSALLPGYEEIADKDGPLELVSEEANSSNAIYYLREDVRLQKRLRLSEAQLNKLEEIHSLAIKLLFAVPDSASHMQEMDVIAKKEIAEAYEVLDEVQRRQLRQWMASLYFVVNPKRVLSKTRVRDYLGLNEEKDWIEISQHIDRLEKDFELQLQQFDAAVVARLLDVLPATKRGEASQLFGSVW